MAVRGGRGRWANNPNRAGCRRILAGQRPYAIPAWGIAPGNHPQKPPRANGPIHHAARRDIRRIERAKPNHIARWVTPRWGLECCGVVGSQGVALGYRVDAPLARKTLRTKGANPISLGHRPRKRAKKETKG